MNSLLIEWFVGWILFSFVSTASVARWQPDDKELVVLMVALMVLWPFTVPMFVVCGTMVFLFRTLRGLFHKEYCR